MKLKFFAITGLLFLIVNQLLLLKGNEFIQTQEPIDYVHWLLFIGVLLTLSFNYIFADNIFSNVATILTSLGVIALVGQAMIDFLWWSYGTDYTGMNDLTNQILNEPSIRIPFMTIGPALFYIGLAVHASKFIRAHPIWTLMAMLGVLIIGYGSFAADSRILISIGHIVMSAGLTVLILRKDTPNNAEQQI